ncbi:hypothetical protein [Thauera sinica]|uniref:Uncharacterized protein n=1 Tax=Thauera sinica TaxID=2665146 RepID=A0ABW1AX64_9RHOO|nr:hypothetical protein [Thauera sp. K11]ATE58900.1 hypothetical protein CCZ27_02040 [Thauera sp. K11]
MEIRKPLMCALPLLLAGLFLIGDATSDGRNGSSLSGNGYAPGVCEIEPPAELLALADWPLDSRNRCLGGSNVADAGTAAATLAEVVEARVRPVREILVAGLGEQPAGDAQAVSHDAPDHVAAVEPQHGQPSAHNDETAYGEAEALSSQLEKAAAAHRHKASKAVELLARAGVDDGRLDDLRGGFQTPDGLSVSFGIERVVYVNGVLQSTTALRVEDLGQLQGGGAGPAVVLPPGATVALVQNGSGNTAATNALSGSALGTIIQNSLDNQKIQTVTTINANVNSIQALQGMRMQHSLQEALNRATLMR